MQTISPKRWFKHFCFGEEITTKRFALVSCIDILAFASANAQEFSRFTADVGFGYTVPAGGTGQYVDTGWNIGVGVNFSPYLGAALNVGADSMGINSTTLGNIGITGGSVHVFHATVDPVVHLTPKGRVDFYLTGGGGLFRRYQDLPAGTTNAYIPFLCLNSAPFGANHLLASSSVNKPGFERLTHGFSAGHFRIPLVVTRTKRSSRACSWRAAEAFHPGEKDSPSPGDTCHPANPPHSSQADIRCEDPCRFWRWSRADR